VDGNTQSQDESNLALEQEGKQAPAIILSWSNLKILCCVSLLVEPPQKLGDEVDTIIIDGVMHNCHKAPPGGQTMNRITPKFER
jgi:hypothetical protein